MKGNWGTRWGWLLQAPKLNVVNPLLSNSREMNGWGQGFPGQAVFGEKWSWIHRDYSPPCLFQTISPMAQGRFFFNKRCSCKTQVIDRRQVSLTRRVTVTLYVSKGNADAVYQRKEAHYFGILAKICNVNDGLLAVVEQLGILGSQIICSTFGCFDACCY